MAVTKSNKSNITSPNGNSLALFIDINDDKLKMKDINGEIQPLDDFVSGSDGTLQIEGGVPLSASLQNVTDVSGNISQLQLSTNATKVNGNLEVASDLDVGGNTNIDGNTLILGTLEVDNTTKIKTANETYLDIEDGAGNNRFTIGKATGSQKVTLDYASNPTSSTEIVGSIRTYQNGTILSDIATFRRDGQVTFVERVNVEADSLVTTQTSSVIASTTTNANMVIAPNGTGALIADIPDGTATGGNARGTNSVDLQTNRSAATQVTTANNSFIGGGRNNTVSIGYGANEGGVVVGGVGNRVEANYGFIGGGSGNSVAGFDDYQVIVGGLNNTITSSGHSVIAGGLSNVISGGGAGFRTISGGQSNTASTNTHATVVGGFQNTSSGQYSVSGGQGNTASGQNSVAIGNGNISAALDSYSFGKTNNANTNRSYAFGVSNTINGFDGVAVGSNNVIGGGATSGHAFGISNNITAGTAGVAIGNGNTVSASQAVAVGYGAIANAAGSVSMSNGGRTDGQFSVTMGQASLTYLYSQISHASGTMTGFSAERGTAQASLLTAFKLPTALTTGATMVLSLDGTGTTNLIIPSGSNRMWKVKVEFIGTISAITGTATGLAVGNSVYGESNFGFKRVGGVSSMGAFIDDAQASDNAIMDTCSLAETAGASGELALTFTGPTFAGGGSVTMRVVAKVSLVEVAY